MSTVDFCPAPGAAPTLRRTVSHALTETRLLVRNGEQLLLALVIPVGLLASGRFLGGRFGQLTTLAPSVIALAIWSSAFTSVAIATGFERRYGVLERLASTPLGRPGLLAGKSLSVVLVVAGQVAILVAVAAVLGWRPRWSGPSFLLSLLVTVLSVATFSCLALALAGRFRAEVTLAAANLIYVVFLAAGALVLPLARYPGILRPAVRLLPTAALGEGLRAGSVGHLLWWPVGVLAAWLVAAAVTAGKGFRWTS